MTLPLDLSKPEARPFQVVFFTTEENDKWLRALDAESDLGVSLICHRIVQAAREAASQSDGERRKQGERRSA